MNLLLVVDVQRDFCPGGSLGVKDGDRIVPLINKKVESFIRNGDRVAYTRDWHPADHISFKDNKNGSHGIWPPHCVRGTEGAEFHKDLEVLGPIFSKGMHKTIEEYSALKGGTTPLGCFIRGADFDTIVVCGIATDYCVKEHVLDLRRMNRQVIVLSDLSAAVNVKTTDGEQALKDMALAGAIVL